MLAKLSSDNTDGRGLARDVCSAQSHRDADVRALERGCVVHPVPCHGDDLAPCLKRACDPRLVFGTTSGADDLLWWREHCGNCIVGHGVELASDNDTSRLVADSHLTRDLGRSLCVVARNDVDADACLVAGGDRARHLGSRWVEQRDEAQESEVAFSVAAVRWPGCGVELAICDRQHPESPARKRIRGRCHSSAIGVGNLSVAVDVEDGRASRYDRLRGALHMEAGARANHVDSRRQSKLGLERVHVDAARCVDVFTRAKKDAGGLHHCGLGGVELVGCRGICVGSSTCGDCQGEGSLLWVARELAQVGADAAVQVEVATEHPAGDRIIGSCRVPVLSVQSHRCGAESVSGRARHLTTAPRFASTLTPAASASVIVGSMPSGTFRDEQADRERERALDTETGEQPQWQKGDANDNSDDHDQLATCLTCFSSGLSTCLPGCDIAAMRPSSVWSPVA